jgi:hypothetical protein
MKAGWTLNAKQSTQPESTTTFTVHRVPSDRESAFSETSLVETNYVSHSDEGVTLWIRITGKFTIYFVIVTYDFIFYITNNYLTSFEHYYQQ